MYYTGTKTQLEAYLAEVNAEENYTGSTSKWAEITKHHIKNEYAIVAHPDYSSELSSVEALPEDWVSNTTI